MRIYLQEVLAMILEKMVSAILMLPFLQISAQIISLNPVMNPHLLQGNLKLSQVKSSLCIYKLQNVIIFYMILYLSVSCTVTSYFTLKLHLLDCSPLINRYTMDLKQNLTEGRGSETNKNKISNDLWPIFHSSYMWW